MSSCKKAKFFHLVVKTTCHISLQIVGKSHDDDYLMNHEYHDSCSLVTLNVLFIQRYISKNKLIPYWSQCKCKISCNMRCSDLESDQNLSSNILGSSKIFWCISIEVKRSYKSRRKKLDTWLLNFCLLSSRGPGHKQI